MREYDQERMHKQPTMPTGYPQYPPNNLALLGHLEELRSNGIITEEEYAIKRRQIVGY